MFSYFDFYAIPVQFRLDKQNLRKRFLQRSRELHPDFNTHQAEQDTILEEATLNNKMYEILSDDEKRVHYILSEKGLLGDDSKNALPQSFLLDMMDINEALMELEFDYQEEIFFKINKEIQTLETSLYLAVNELLNTDNAHTLSSEDWAKLKIFYLKRRYLLRILEKLRTFAPQ